MPRRRDFITKPNVAIMTLTAAHWQIKERVTNMQKMLDKKMKVGERIKYRGYEITFDYPPIPCRDIDYSFAIKDWDLDDPRIGTGSSVKDCKEQIDEQIAEHNEGKKQ